MPITISGQIYYRTAEACQRAGISKATLFRWLEVGIIADVANKDRRGWRLFTKDDIKRIKTEASRTSELAAQEQEKGSRRPTVGKRVLGKPGGEKSVPAEKEYREVKSSVKVRFSQSPL